MSNGRSRERAQDVWVRGGGVYLLGPDGEPLTSVPVEFDMSSALPVTLNGSIAAELRGNSLSHNGKVTLTINEEAVVAFPAGFTSLTVHNSGPGPVHVAVDEEATGDKFRLEEGMSLSGLRGTELHLLAPTNAPTVAYLGE